MRIDQDRLWADLEALAAFGRNAGGGIDRPALGEADRAARQWLVERMEAAGLKVSIDAAANISGRLACADPKAPAVVIGSHLDTVPDGGMFDGALGVLAGLECARVLAATGVRLPWALEVINFTDEEGHHNAGTFGSRAMMGGLEPGEQWRQKDVGSTSIAQSLQAVGADPERLDEARRDPGQFCAYFELHIEQGDRLESAGLELGIVTGIVGIYRYVVSVAGQTNHAGTTSMRRRRDALVTAAPLLSLLPQWAMARSDDMVATVGQLALEPGAVNVIPGRCVFTVELRALDPSHMQQLRELLKGHVEQLAGSSVAPIFEKDGVWLDQGLMELLGRAAAAVDFSATSMPSGAGHDAQTFAPHVPTAMLFVPSRGGVSHCPGEWTEPRHAAAGAEVLLEALLQLAEADAGGPRD